MPSELSGQPIPADEFPVGTVLMMEKTFGRSDDPSALGFATESHSYTFVFLKAHDEFWYSTGALDSNGRHGPVNWSEVVYFISQFGNLPDVIMRAVAWQPI